MPELAPLPGVYQRDPMRAALDHALRYQEFEPLDAVLATGQPLPWPQPGKPHPLVYAFVHGNVPFLEAYRQRWQQQTGLPTFPAEVLYDLMVRPSNRADHLASVQWADAALRAAFPPERDPEIWQVWLVCQTPHHGMLGGYIINRPDLGTTAQWLVEKGLAYPWNTPVQGVEHNARQGFPGFTDRAEWQPLQVEWWRTISQTRTDWPDALRQTLAQWCDTPEQPVAALDNGSLPNASGST